MKRAVFAEPAVLLSYEASCENLSLPTGVDGPEDVLNFLGWRFRTHHAKILDSPGLNCIAKQIARNIASEESSDDHIRVAGHDLHVPAMIFGKDIFKIESIRIPISIEFNASDALTCWADQHSPDSIARQPLKIVQVPYAKSWSERLEREQMEQAGGSDFGTPSSPGAVDITHKERFLWDWTFSTDYCCSVSRTDVRETSIDSARTLSTIGQSLKRNSIEELAEPMKSFAPTSWYQTDSSGINYDLLRARDVPILFFDEVTLYQDDLEDCGEVSLNVKLRVMPSCWFILSRFFLRVDGAVVRVRDTRIFHRFGDDSVHMEITWKEQGLADHEEIILQGAKGRRSSKEGRLNSTGSGSGSSSPTAAAPAAAGATMTTATPNKQQQQQPPQPLGGKILRSPAELADILPSVNDLEGIQKYYSMNI